jgi:hypothetical protein
VLTCVGIDLEAHTHGTQKLHNGLCPPPSAVTPARPSCDTSTSSWDYFEPVPDIMLLCPREFQKMFLKISMKPHTSPTFTHKTQRAQSPRCHSGSWCLTPSCGCSSIGSPRASAQFSLVLCDLVLLSPVPQAWSLLTMPGISISLAPALV